MSKSLSPLILDAVDYLGAVLLGSLSMNGEGTGVLLPLERVIKNEASSSRFERNIPISSSLSISGITASNDSNDRSNDSSGSLSLLCYVDLLKIDELYNGCRLTITAHVYLANFKDLTTIEL